MRLSLRQEDVCEQGLVAGRPLWAVHGICRKDGEELERETGVEPATSSLGSLRSTPELLASVLPIATLSEFPKHALAQAEQNS